MSQINYVNAGPTFFGDISQIITFINTTFPAELKATSFVTNLLDRLNETITQQHDVIYKQIVTLIKVESGDWEGIYLNNTLFCEGHSVSNNQWMKMLREKFNFPTNRITLTNAQVEELGYSLPDTLAEVTEVVQNQ